MAETRSLFLSSSPVRFLSDIFCELAAAVPSCKFSRLPFYHALPDLHKVTDVLVAAVDVTGGDGAADGPALPQRSPPSPNRRAARLGLPLRGDAGARRAAEELEELRANAIGVLLRLRGSSSSSSSSPCFVSALFCYSSTRSAPPQLPLLLLPLPSSMPVTFPSDEHAAASTSAASLSGEEGREERRGRRWRWGQDSSSDSS
eukprot:761323-Hanusia_phi.AAC.3